MLSTSEYLLKSYRLLNQSNQQAHNVFAVQTVSETCFTWWCVHYFGSMTLCKRHLHSPTMLSVKRRGSARHPITNTCFNWSAFGHDSFAAPAWLPNGVIHRFLIRAVEEHNVMSRRLCWPIFWRTAWLSLQIISLHSPVARHVWEGSSPFGPSTPLHLLSLPSK